MKDAEILSSIEAKIEQLVTARDALRKAFAGEGGVVAVSAKAPEAPKKAGRPQTEATRERLREVWRLKKRAQTAAAKKAAVETANKTAPATKKTRPPMSKAAREHLRDVQKRIWREKQSKQAAAKAGK